MAARTCSRIALSSRDALSDQHGSSAESHWQRSTRRLTNAAGAGASGAGTVSLLPLRDHRVRLRIVLIRRAALDDRHAIVLSECAECR